MVCQTKTNTNLEPNEDKFCAGRHIGVYTRSGLSIGISTESNTFIDGDDDDDDNSNLISIFRVMRVETGQNAFLLTSYSLITACSRSDEMASVARVKCSLGRYIMSAVLENSSYFD